MNVSLSLASPSAPLGFAGFAGSPRDGGLSRSFGSFVYTLAALPVLVPALAMAGLVLLAVAAVRVVRR